VNWSVSPGGDTQLTDYFERLVQCRNSGGIHHYSYEQKQTDQRRPTVTIGVTDLTAVTTYHNNLSRDGNQHAGVRANHCQRHNRTFGKLFSARSIRPPIRSHCGLHT